MSIEFTGEIHPAANIFPMLSSESLADLAADIAENGLHDPLWITADGALLDGRNRLAACSAAGVEPRFSVYDGSEPTSFVVSMNVKRRHLTTGQRAMLALDILPALEAEAKVTQIATLKQNASVVADLPQRTDPKPASERKSRAKAAKVTRTSSRAVAQAKRVAEKAPDLVDRVLSDDPEQSLALDRADRIVRDREAEAKRISKAKVDAEQRETKSTVDLRCGDFREVLADLENVDAIITDPPYPREFLPLLADLAAWADKVLTPNGVLAVLFGQTYLPEVYRLLDGHRPYRWTAAYLTPGSGYASMSARVQSNWKPVLIYGGGPRFTDTITATGTDASAKDLHVWGQDYAAFDTLIGRLTIPGQTVVDPFMGSGTTLLAAHAHGCNIIGADIDAEHVATTRRRLP